MKNKLLILILLLFIYFCGSKAQQTDSRPYLVVLSMDGFRWDYPDSFPTPNLHSIMNRGVHAKSLIPAFPSVTFPNHYSIATGLYPDHHGIVNNNFYAPDLKQNFQYNKSASTGDGRFFGGEPIWITAEKQHVKTANFFWVGSEAEIEGVRPTYWKKYSTSVTFEQRIDTVLHWLSLPDSLRPHLVMFYFDQPDHLTHSIGPAGPDVRRMIMHLDSLVGDIETKLEQLPIGNQVNFMIVSDHGMEAISDSRKIVLDHYIKTNWCERIIGHTPMLTIDPKPGCTDSIIMQISVLPHLKIWAKENLPSRFHYGTNPRIGELVILADSSYSLSFFDKKIDMAGNHGYDNQNTDMHGIFYAIGPSFKKGYLQESFENINL